MYAGLASRPVRIFRLYYNIVGPMVGQREQLCLNAHPPRPRIESTEYLQLFGSERALETRTDADGLLRVQYELTRTIYIIE